MDELPYFLTKFGADWSSIIINNSFSDWLEIW